jgi:hypothetical protein
MGGVVAWTLERVDAALPGVARSVGERVWLKRSPAKRNCFIAPRRENPIANESACSPNPLVGRGGAKEPALETNLEIFTRDHRA